MAADLLFQTRVTTFGAGKYQLRFGTNVKYMAPIAFSASSGASLKGQGLLTGRRHGSCSCGSRFE